MLLEIEDLHAHARTRTGIATLLNGVSLSVAEREIVGLIGETGAGKSLTAWSVIGLLEQPVRIVKGAVRFRGRNLTEMSEAELQRVRGRDIALIVQNPRGSLDPLTSIGTQISTLYRVHRGVSRSAARRRALEMLEAVGIPDPSRRMKAYPHELSGGMAQRVLIAMAMINDPALVIADEPTTGLDVTVQAQILDLIRARSIETGSSVLLVTHDLGVVAHYTQRVAVMFAGRIVEAAPTRELFSNARHPYTQALIGSTPERMRFGSRVSSAAQPPDLENLPGGCHYAYRCPFATGVCREPVPTVSITPGHTVLCHLPQEQS